MPLWLGKKSKITKTIFSTLSTDRVYSHLDLIKVINLCFRLALALISNTRAMIRKTVYNELSKHIAIDGFGKYFKKEDPCKRNYTCMGR